MIRGEGSSTAFATAVVPVPPATSFSSSIDAYGSRRGFATGAGTPSTARRNAMPRPRPPARARRFESTRGTRNAASPFAPPPNTSRMPCPEGAARRVPAGTSLVPAGTSLVPAGTSLVLVVPSSSTPASTFSSSSSSSSDAKGVPTRCPYLSVASTERASPIFDLVFPTTANGRNAATSASSSTCGACSEYGTACTGGHSGS